MTFNFLFGNWYEKTSNMDVRTLVLNGINWIGVLLIVWLNWQKKLTYLLKVLLNFLEFNTRKHKLLKLKELYGDNIFNIDSDLHIYGPDSIFAFGPEDNIVLEGNSSIWNSYFL